MAFRLFFCNPSSPCISRCPCNASPTLSVAGATRQTDRMGVADMAKLEGIILAAGISSRMGFPKALMPVGDSFFLLQVYRRVALAGAKPVHIVINSGLRSSLDAQMEKFDEGEFVLNTEPAKGQLHSLQLGIKAAQTSGAQAALVALVDQPFIKEETIAQVVAAAAQAPDKIIVARHNGQNGHPFIVPARVFDDFISAPSHTTARDVIHAHEPLLLFADVDDPAVLADVNSPEDLMKF